MKLPLPKFQLWLLVLLAAGVAGVAALTGLAVTPSFSFEVAMHSSGGGVSQLFYDVGRSITQEDSVRVDVRDSKLIYRYPLPEAEHRLIRFDPLDRGNSNISITRARVVDILGRTVRNFALEELNVANGVSKSELKDGKLLLTLGPTDGDSIIVVNPSPPLSLRAAPSARWLFAARAFLVCFLPVLLSGVLLLLLLKWVWSSVLAGRWSRFLDWSRRNPRKVLLLVAITATLVNCHPVVFFGKSFISPNNGALYLYDRLPTLPGYTSSNHDDAAGADVGAAAWFHVPYGVVESRALFRDFELPLWNRYDSCGVTLLGQGQSMFGDPLHFLVLFTGGSSLAWDIKFLLAKILFAWAIGLTILIATRHLPSALILTGSSVFLGFFAFRYDHAAIFSVCYAPWIVYTWFRIREATTSRELALWVAGLILANWTEINSGTVKEAYGLLLGMNGCGFLVFLLASEPLGLKLKKLVHVVGGGVLFGAISMPIWLTFLDALKSAHTLYNTPGVWNIQPNLLIGLFDDMFYRQFISGEGAFNPSANFLVLLGFLFALGHFGTLRRDSAYRALGIGMMIAFAMAFAVVPPKLIVKIPFIGNIIHIGNTFSCVLLVLLLLMAGFGVREFWRRLSEKETQGGLSASFLLLALLLWLYIGFIHASSPSGPALHDHVPAMSTFFYWYASSLLLALIALPFIVRAIVRYPVTRVALVPALVLCLFLIHWRHAMYLTTPVDQYVLNPQIRASLSAYSPAVDFVTRNKAELYRTVGLGDNLFPGFNAALAVESFNGAEPLVNPFYRQFTEAWKIEKAWDWRLVVNDQNLVQVKPLTDMLNVKYFLGSSNNAPDEHLKLVDKSDMNVYQSDLAWPRAFFVDGITLYDDVSQLVDLIRDSNGRAFAAMEASEVSSRPELTSLPMRQNDQPAVPAFDYKLTNNTTSFKVVAPARGVVALTEAYLPGDFRVTVNGKATPYFRVNHAFKAVAIDHPGTYTIKMSYWPRNFTMSLFVAAAGLAALAGYLFLFRRQRPATA